MFSHVYPCFPNEIFAQIISFLDVDTETLGSVACVSKDLYALACPLLFSRILVSSEKDLGTLDSKIARHVRRVRIRHQVRRHQVSPPHWLASKVLNPLLEHATQLHSIHICGPEITVWKDYSNDCQASLIAILSKVEEAVLDGAHLPASVVREMRNAKRLEVPYFPYSYSDIGQAGAKPGPRLALMSFAIEWISSPPDIFDYSNLKRLYLSAIDPIYSRQIINILSQCKQTLESLRLHFDDADGLFCESGIFVYLSHMTSLQELYIAVTSRFLPLLCLSVAANAILLSSLDKRLEIIQLIIIEENTFYDSQMRKRHGGSKPREWSLLDRGLSQLLIMEPKLQVVLRLPKSAFYQAREVHEFVAWAMPTFSENGRSILKTDDLSKLRSLFKLDDLKF